MNNAHYISLHKLWHIHNVVQALLLLILCIMSMACSRKHDTKLQHIASYVSYDSEQALHALDSIDYEKLSDSDRHFYDFLIIKARDKAFINHESDSLILDVIEYYSTRPSDPIYPEVLYYGGRVYSDLGDYPTALRYFQQALDNPGQAPDTMDLKNRLNSQIGGLLHKLRLYKESVPCYLQMLVMKIEDNDSSGIVYAQQGLGSAYFNLGTLEGNDSIKNQYLETSDSILTRSLDYASTLSESYTIDSRTLLSGVKQAEGDINYAVNLIRHMPERADSIQRNMVLAYAADIYLEAGILDTAYMYAHELIANEDITNKKTGYRIILSPEFRSLIHPDTLNQYYTDYKNILEAYFDDNANEQALMQESQYNYQLHERESLSAQKKSELRAWVIVGFAFVVIVLAFVILYLKYRNRNNIIKLREAIDTLQVLRRGMGLSPNMCESSSGNTGMPVPVTSMSEKELRKKLQQELMDLYKRTENIATPQGILDSKIYSELHESIAKNKAINNDAVWDELEKTVLAVSPEFICRLKLLTGNRLTSIELHTALLLKCGFKPSEMTILLSRSNGAIISRRNVLSEKVLGKKSKVQVIDGIIKLL